MSTHDTWPHEHGFALEGLGSGLNYGQFMDNFLRGPDPKELDAVKPGRWYDWRRKDRKEN